jgi:hypothetical protein
MISLFRLFLQSGYYNFPYEVLRQDECEKYL